MVTANHQMPVIPKEIMVAVTPDIPSFSAKRIRSRQAVKGIQLPIYPHAYPCEDTMSILSSVVTSASMES